MTHKAPHPRGFFLWCNGSANREGACPQKLGMSPSNERTLQMNPTEEQARAIAAAQAGKSIALQAMAGTGKSTTLKLIARAVPNKRILLTAFSAQVIADAKAANFPPNVKVQSNHGLAYFAFGAKYRDAGRMQRRLTPRVVVEVLGLTDKQCPADLRPVEIAHIALEAVTRFQSSAAPLLVTDFVHVPASIKERRGEVKSVAFAIAQKIWSHMTDLSSKLPISHDSYFKMWALTNPVLRCELCLVDEAQDTSSTMLGVLKKQQCQMIVVGDPRQAIFSFRGAVDAMSLLKVDERIALTQSWRFGPTIASAANAVLLAHGNSDLTVKGSPHIKDRIDALPEGLPYTIIARTNSKLIGHVVNPSKRVGVVGGVGDLLRLVEGAEKLQRGEKALQCPDLIDFASWYEVKQYAESPSGGDLGVLVKLVDEYGTARLRDMLRGVEGNEADESRCDLLLTTAHRSKGREWDRVFIDDDFPIPNDADLGKGPADAKSKWTPEEANLLYVALTRGKQVLNVMRHGAWLDAVERCLAEEIALPGVTDDARFNEAIDPAEVDRAVVERDPVSEAMALSYTKACEDLLGPAGRPGSGLQHFQVTLIREFFLAAQTGIALPEAMGKARALFMHLGEDEPRPA